MLLLIGFNQSAQDFKFIVFPGAGFSVNELIDAGKSLAEVFFISYWFQIHIMPRLRRFGAKGFFVHRLHPVHLVYKI